MVKFEVEKKVSLKPFVTLRAGGPAEELVRVDTRTDLVNALEHAKKHGKPFTILGRGSNVLPADDGVPGLVVINRTDKIEFDSDGLVTADTGCLLQELFLKTAQARLSGFQFAVGIPGTIGGALASNAGAYRSCIGDFITEIEVAVDDSVQWYDPSWLQFSYRDSLLRKPIHPDCIVTRVRFKIPSGDPKTIYDEARDHQRQRISKQPPPASAGSFFKNVNDRKLAYRLPTLPKALKEAAVVPAGYLLEEVGMRGFSFEGAMFSKRHANFMLNVGNATASAIRRLADTAKEAVKDHFGVELEEEVLYIGDWSKKES